MISIKTPNPPTGAGSTGGRRDERLKVIASVRADDEAGELVVTPGAPQRLGRRQVGLEADYFPCEYSQFAL